MRFFPIFIPLLVSLTVSVSSVLAEAPAPAATEEETPIVMVRVGDQDITVEQFMQFLSQNPTRVHEATTVEGKGLLLRTLVESELLRQAMVQAGLMVPGATAAEQKQAFDVFVKMQFPVPGRPDDAALQDYYDKNKDSFGIPASVRLSQIQLRVPEGASEEETVAVRARAEAALARLNAGEPFAEVAADLTENPRTKGTNGDLGFVWRKGSEWLEHALQGLAVGQHTGVLESPVGYDILMLTEEREAIITPFDEVRDRVAERMQADKQEIAKQAYLKSLAEKTPVVIVQDDLKAAFPNGLFAQ